MAYKLVSTKHASLEQDSYWATMSESLVELSFRLAVSDELVHMSVLTQLTKLTRLEICGVWPMYHEELRESPSYELNLPALESLHMAKRVTDLKLNCPRLRSLTLDYCLVFGTLSLQAPLEELSCRAFYGPGVHEGFPLSNLLGVTSLHYHCKNQSSWFRQINGMSLNGLYSILPKMSKLRILELIISDGGLPESLPASLLKIRYWLGDCSGLDWDKVLKSFEDNCKLPELQCISLARQLRWEPEARSKLQEIRDNSKAQVILKENMIWDQSFKLTGHQFFSLYFDN